ncbi:MAG: hypothetical protein AAF564_02560, partial [Bacteroidota bacterium]
MKIFLSISACIFLLVFAGCQNSTSTEQALAASTAVSSVDGVWQIVEAYWVHREHGAGQNVDRIQPSLFQFQEGFYSMTALNAGEPRPAMDEGATLDALSDELLRAIVLPYVSHA